MYLFPSARRVGLSSGVDSALVFVQSDQSDCQFGKVADVIVQKFGRVEHAIFETSISRLQNTCAFEITETVEKNRFAANSYEKCSRKFTSIQNYKK